MAKRFTVQKRARMRVVGWQQVEKQWAWEASEYVGEARPHKPAATPKAKRAGSKPAKLVPLQYHGKGVARTPIYDATDWNDGWRIGEIYRNGEIVRV